VVVERATHALCLMLTGCIDADFNASAVGRFVLERDTACVAQQFVSLMGDDTSAARVLKLSEPGYAGGQTKGCGIKGARAVRNIIIIDREYRRMVTRL